MVLRQLKLRDIPNFTIKNMAILELLIGISIGFALGIIIMIVLSTKEDVEGSDLFGIDDLEEQIHESGFIDVPVRHLVVQRKQKDSKNIKAYKKRIEKFKLRNRFYR